MLKNRSQNGNQTSYSAGCEASKQLHLITNSSYPKQEYRSYSGPKIPRSWANIYNRPRNHAGQFRNNYFNNRFGLPLPLIELCIEAVALIIEVVNIEKVPKTIGDRIIIKAIKANDVICHSSLISKLSQTTLETLDISFSKVITYEALDLILRGKNQSNNSNFENHQCFDSWEDIPQSVDMKLPWRSRLEILDLSHCDKLDGPGMNIARLLSEAAPFIRCLRLRGWSKLNALFIPLILRGLLHLRTLDLSCCCSFRGQDLRVLQQIKLGNELRYIGWIGNDRDVSSLEMLKKHRPYLYIDLNGY